MKPATPMPMSTSASSTLTAAMMPSSRLVVPRSACHDCCPQNGDVWCGLGYRALAPSVASASFSSFQPSLATPAAFSTVRGN